ncbi:flagella basal body P-ring formation protein FlgA [Burkholderia theae]|uniref:flagella basal body P-ring formation protein FlgA n=1 Tax=Burkholderia theae TaxID=3143496 RepID=UPI003AFA144F
MMLDRVRGSREASKVVHGSALALLAMLSFSAYAGLDDVVRIDLRGDVEVTHRKVVLGDVAVIRDGDDTRNRRLVALPIGSVPQSGVPVVVSRAVLSAWIEKRVGLRAEQIEWSGDTSSRVHLAMSRVRGDLIGQRAEAALRTELEEGGMHCTISLAHVPADVDVPAGTLTMEVRQIAAPAIQDTAGDRFVSKHQSAWVDLHVDGVFVRTVPVDFDVSVSAPTYVAARDLRVGQVLDPTRPDPTQVKIEEREWSGRPTPPLRVATALDQARKVEPVNAEDSPMMRVRRPVQAGRVLSKADVEPLPKVTRGDYATLREVAGPIALESRVEVMEDGQVGDTVRVRQTGASDTVVARVTGPHAVEVHQ